MLQRFSELLDAGSRRAGASSEPFSLVLLKGGVGPNLRLSRLTEFALLFLKLNDQAVSVAWCFFAVYCLLIGCLPRIDLPAAIPRRVDGSRRFGPLADVSRRAASGPSVSSHFARARRRCGSSLMLWLLVMGVKAERWQEQAGTTGTLGLPARERHEG